MSLPARSPTGEWESDPHPGRTARLSTGLRLILGGALLGGLVGVFAGALLGAAVGAFRGDASLGLDGAVYGSLLATLLGGYYGLTPALRLWRSGPARPETGSDHRGG